MNTSRTLITLLVSFGSFSSAAHAANDCPVAADTIEEDLLEMLGYLSDPSTDTDGDGMPDEYETDWCSTDPTTSDSDDDNLTDIEELNIGTDPNLRDTDGGGVLDGDEVHDEGTDPLDTSDDITTVARNELGCSLTIQGTDLVAIGCNVHIQSGSGATDDNGSLTGSGNLFVGYNEGVSDDVQTGSHNLIIGDDHSFTSYGGLVAGRDNKISGQYASVTGGMSNEAGGYSSSVSGGRDNTASWFYASVSGGYYNEASGKDASVSGGVANEASGEYASVSGGYDNEASGLASSVSGGESNSAYGTSSSVSGGDSQGAYGWHDWAAGSLREDD